jgi:peptide-methionine (S)-S-oxide reductase
METATFAGGCFWCTEAIFQRLKGVISVISGYTGGSVENPTYEQVCSGTTGHAEAIQITFDPAIISFETLLEVFFKLHDPTTLNRQGGDSGTQYRSAVFYHDEKQKLAVETMINQLNNQKLYPNPIVTKIEPYQKFYKAEEYHQDFYKNNAPNPYCTVIIDPKIRKLMEEFKENVKTD